MKECRPCRNCQQFFFNPLFDEEQVVRQVRQISNIDDRSHSKRRNRQQRLRQSDLKQHNQLPEKCPDQEQKPKRQPVLGCDDSHIGPYHMYKNMLRQERQHFEKINRIAYGCAERFEGVLTEAGKSSVSTKTSETHNLQQSQLQLNEVSSSQVIGDSFFNDSAESSRFVSF